MKIFYKNKRRAIEFWNLETTTTINERFYTIITNAKKKKLKKKKIEKQFTHLIIYGICMYIYV